MVNEVKEFISKDEGETEKLAYDFAKTLSNNDIVVLDGNLGAGKTKFMYGLAKYFNIENLVSSPTFTIVNEYPLKEEKNNIKCVYHFDVYRLSGSDDFLDSIGTDYFSNGLCVIEWGKIIKDILPSSAIYISIEHISSNDNFRKITIYEKGDISYENIRG